MSFRDFDKWHKPKRALYIRISTHMIGMAGVAVATLIGKRKERKRQARIQAARDKARR